MSTTKNYLLGRTDNDEVYIWDLNSYELINIIKIPEYFSNPIDYDESGLLVMGRKNIFMIGNDSKIIHNIEDFEFVDAALAPDQTFLIYCIRKYIDGFWGRGDVNTAYVFSLCHSILLPLQVYSSANCCAISSDSKHIAIGYETNILLFASNQETLILLIPTESYVFNLEFEKNTNNILACTEDYLQVWTTCKELLFCIRLGLEVPPQWTRFSERQVCVLTARNRLIVYDVESKKNISRCVILKPVLGATCMSKDGERMVSQIDNYFVVSPSWKKKGNSKKF